MIGHTLRVVAGGSGNHAAPPLVSGIVTGSRPDFQMFEATAGFRATRDVTLRGSYYTRRLYGAADWTNEAGVSVVTLRIGTWDYHGTTSGTGNIFTGLRTQLPLLDQSIYALVSDLHERGLDKEVAVLVWGEFGRTPRVNKVEGRDHWPDAGFALFAGGGLRTGQVVGETDAKAERPKTRALGAQDVLATVYQSLGIDLNAKLPDFSDRPMALLDDGKPIAELI